MVLKSFNESKSVTNGQMDECPRSNMPSNFFEVGGIKSYVVVLIRSALARHILVPITCLCKEIRTRFQCYFIKREITLNWGIIRIRKKVRLNLFFHEESIYEINISKHGSKRMLCTIKQQH